MLDLANDEREHLQNMGALVTNASGEEVFSGLTLEETNFYLSYTRTARSGGLATADETERYLALNEKHEMARRSIVNDEAMLRADSKLRN